MKVLWDMTMGDYVQLSVEEMSQVDQIVAAAIKAGRKDATVLAHVLAETQWAIGQDGALALDYRPTGGAALSGGRIKLKRPGRAPKDGAGKASTPKRKE